MPAPADSLLRIPPLALYVHFPWCVRKCPYCDFNSYTLHGELPQEAYLARLERDLESQAAQVDGREVISVFLGGGTPSLFSPRAIARLLECARRHFRLAADTEVTLEANPGAIERGAFGEYRAAGVTRVSLGAQSFDPQRLAALGRIHSPADTRAAAGELHAAGLDNFNLDLMYGLPGQALPDAQRDVLEALALHPAHLSHYHLTVEAGTVFAAQRPALPDEDLAAAMRDECCGRLASAGLRRYEVSAWARPGAQCRHNLNYWHFGDYLGAGAGAHGKLSYPASGHIVRTLQPREPRRYLAAADADLGRCTVDAQDLPFEFMLNALRLTAGFTPTHFTSRTGLRWGTVARPIRAAIGRGLLLRSGERYVPTERGLEFLNEILLDFLPEKPKKPAPSALSMATARPPTAPSPPLFTAPHEAVGE